MTISLEERTHESSLFTKTAVLTALIDKGYLRMGNGGVDPLSLAKLMNEYVLYAPSNADVIARMVSQPANLVYGKLLQHMDIFEKQRTDVVRRLDTMSGTFYLCPVAKLEDVLLEKNTTPVQSAAKPASATPRPRRKSEEVVIYEGVPLGRYRQYTREEIISNTPINRSRLEKFISAGVLPDAEVYSGKDVGAILLKMENRVLVDELIEDCLNEREMLARLPEARTKLSAALKKPEIQRTYGITDIGVKEPLYTAEKERFIHVVRRVVDSL